MSLPNRIVVRNAFNEYRRGDVIEDEKEIKKIIEQFSSHINPMSFPDVKQSAIKGVK